MINSSQSLFGIVSDDANWTYDGVVASDYWTTHTSINLTQEDFDLQDNLLTLKADAIKYFSSFDADTLDLIINIDLSKTQATGFSKNAFGDLSINKIIVSSVVEKTFTYYSAPCQIIATENVTLEVVV